ncbi:MAG: hypothetical protein NT157_04845 [Candidatus Micrarchaeota archaeon]|nr:hypothetical protein [Candidatus Micrarchaeota archaeon]
MASITSDKAKLLGVLKKEIENADGKIAILAGHFALIHDKGSGKLVPGIFQELGDMAQKEATMAHPYMGHFPSETWKLGVLLGKHASEMEKDAAFVILVNDWQWVEKVGFGEDNPYRQEFYQKSELPELFQSELRGASLNEEMVLPFRMKDGRVNNRFFLSEQRLRSQFGNYYSNTCDLENQCAREFIPLLLQLHKEEIKLLISFIPRTCMTPINSGSQAAKEIFGVEMRIVNVFVNGTFQNDFWEATEIHSF